MKTPAWTAADAAERYNLPHWGDGYFNVSAEGHLMVQPFRDASPVAVDLYRLAQQLPREGLDLPVLVRFTDILRDRVDMLCDAFAGVIADYGYQGRYTAVYPIKVNQQASVVEAIVGHGGSRVGIEAGSKPELATVRGLVPLGSIVVCNGYKDRAYIRRALIGGKLGHRVYIVVEKLSELPLVLEESARLEVAPLIGLRVRLMSISKGNWQNTGGEKSKFGLSAPQLMAAIEHCRAAGRLDCVKLLHFHLGSQVANIQDIKAGMREAARYYTEMRALGAAVETVDVGGGLGVDYEGTHSRSYCSMNYGVGDYARHIVQTLQQQCAQHGLPEPNIISESGRALTAHHAVLLVNITDQEQMAPVTVEAPADDDVAELHQLWELQGLLAGEPGNLIERFSEVTGAWQDIHQRYIAGDLGLGTRARGEQLYINCLLALRGRLNPLRKQQRELLDSLNETLADKLFVNFSVFQSVPDVWGINQVFPVLPLSGLDKPATRRAVIQDITCDSDGRIDQFVDGEGVEATLPLPEQLNGHLGIFMVGAYQEILGDMHNLFGDTDSVDVDVEADGAITLSHAIQGDTVSSVLRYVNYDTDKLLASLEQHCRQAHLNNAEQEGFIELVREGLAGYTYLE